MSGTPGHSDPVLVTGGAGFIGSHLVDRLVATGHRVVVLDDLSTGSRDHLAEASASGRVRLIEGSILEPTALAEAIRGCRGVYHLAVQCVRRSLGDPLGNHEINATGSLRVLEAARAARVERVLYCSSSEVYGNAAAPAPAGVAGESPSARPGLCPGPTKGRGPLETLESALDEQATVCAPTTVYGAAKLAGEHYALAYWRTYRLPVVVVRPFNAYGPREHHRGDLAEVIPRFLIRVLNGQPPVVFGDGRQGRDFTYVTETARGLVLAMACDQLVGGVVNLGHGRQLTVCEVAEQVIRLCGRNDLSVVHAPPRPGDVQSLIADTRRARSLLGFTPEVPFEQGLRHTLDWFRAHAPDLTTLLEPDPVNWRLPPS